MDKDSNRICSAYYKSDINYMLPSNLSYEGQKISKAIDRLSDIQDLDKLRIETEIKSLKAFEEKYKKIIEEKYNQGYLKGVIDGYEKGQSDGYQIREKDGYEIGLMDEYQKGILQRYQKGILQRYQNVQLYILDFYFENFKNGRSLENIEMIGKISYNLIKERYGLSLVVQNFISELLSRDLLN